MNKKERDILCKLAVSPYVNQRNLAKKCNCSLGVVNACVQNLVNEELLDTSMRPVKPALELLKKDAPRNAIILAAGLGMRMVPINVEVPKGLIEVNGETLIERIIKQLHDAGITEIFIVVGFMKERYEYLIDKYQVELIVNSEYAIKNNLHSLKLVDKYLSNTYIVPCDIWCKENPFSKYEPYSWYMVSDTIDNESYVKVNRKMEFGTVTKTSEGNKMIGISYLLEAEANDVREQIEKLRMNVRYNNAFWEEALNINGRIIVSPKVVKETEVIEINTFEQLREIDGTSTQLNAEAIKCIVNQMNVNIEEIVNIEVLKKGMTNRSFLFYCRNQKYIMRIPGEGTNKLINREQEAKVYSVIRGKDLCDNPIYINSANGYKITKYIEDVRCCNPFDENDLQQCMRKLKEFHEMELIVNHEFDIFKMIDFYEELWGGVPSIYIDYLETKIAVFSLRVYIEEHVEKRVLTHIDAVPDNFLLSQTAGGGMAIQLTDWEYAGMQDPHVDIAMFCIYSLYTREQIDHLIDIYFSGKCQKEIRIKIYCYIATCGLLWSNWCEYKRNLGVEFGEYSLRQYRYAKEYYKIYKEEIGEK